MYCSDLILGLKKQGISVSLFQGQLKAEPKALLTDDVRGLITANRQAIITALTKTQPINKDLPPSRDKKKTDIPAQAVDRKRPMKGKAKPSPVALVWLKEHRQELLDSGWTRSELYDRREYRQGIAWMDLWEEAFSRAFLHEAGTIEFECSRYGRDCFQTARPRSMAPTTDNCGTAASCSVGGQDLSSNL